VSLPNPPTILANFWPSSVARALTKLPKLSPPAPAVELEPPEDVDVDVEVVEVLEPTSVVATCSGLYPVAPPILPARGSTTVLNCEVPSTLGLFLVDTSPPSAKSALSFRPPSKTSLLNSGRKRSVFYLRMRCLAFTRCSWTTA